MAIKGGQGQSAHTARKQATLQPILQLIFQSMKYKAAALLFVDLNAGAGWNARVQCDGSPLIALRELTAIDVPAGMVCCEIDNACRAHLERNLYNAAMPYVGGAEGEPYPAVVYRVFGDVPTSSRDREQVRRTQFVGSLLRSTAGHVPALPPTSRWTRLAYSVLADNRDHTSIEGEVRRVLHASRADLYGRSLPQFRGLIYADPNGFQIPVDTLAGLYRNRAYDRIDVLFHLSTTALKRSQTVHASRYGETTLQSMMAPCDKPYWFISEPDTAWQYTFLFGTKWEQFPMPKVGFVRLDTDEGERRLRRCIERQG